MIKEELLAPAETRRRLSELPSWTLSADGRSIRRELAMEGFAAAAELIALVAKAADEMDHHPDAHLTGYRKLAFELSTHSAGGLTEKDFVLARKIEALPKRLKA